LLSAVRPGKTDARILLPGDYARQSADFRWNRILHGELHNIRSSTGSGAWAEAVDLSGSLKPELTIPAHFDIFESNTENPQLFTDYMTVKYPGIPSLIPAHGEKISYHQAAGLTGATS